MRVFHFLPKNFGLQALEKQQLKVALIKDLNDPFELLAADLSDISERRHFQEWKDDTSQRLGFLCFSTTSKNPLLWSHYADRHRGIALELEVDNAIAIPVHYCRTRLKLDIPSIMRNGGFTEGLAEQLGSTKSIHWRYEREVRVAVPLENCLTESDLYFEKVGHDIKIVGVVAGALCKLTAEEVKNRLPRGEKVSLRHSRIAFQSFNIVRNKVKPNETIEGKA